jgi:SPOR domain
MTDTDRELSLQDEDRLPWLEAVDNDDDDDGISSGKLMGFLGAALLALAVVIGGVWWLRGQQQASGDGTLIAAADGDYKVKPDEVGGMKVEGQGDSAFAASEGAEANAKMGAGAQAEVPVAGTRVTEVTPPKPAVPATPSATAAVTTGGKLATPMPTVPAAPVASAPRPGFDNAPVPAAASAGTGLIQLGAYNSQDSANQAWNALVQRNAFLGSMAKSIVPAAVGGTNFYRLRVTAGAQSAATCAKLKAAGANCIVVK